LLIVTLIQALVEQKDVDGNKTSQFLRRSKDAIYPRFSRKFNSFYQLPQLHTQNATAKLSLL